MEIQKSIVYPECASWWDLNLHSNKNLSVMNYKLIKTGRIKSKFPVIKYIKNIVNTSKFTKLLLLDIDCYIICY